MTSRAEPRAATGRRRLVLYVLVTFVITWGAWGTLIALDRAGRARFPEPLFVVLLFLGGFGPTIGAYASVLATRSQAPLAEFHARLFRWRVPARWYLAAFGIPLAVALLEVLVANVIQPGFFGRLELKPWYLFGPTFLFMILGGGLEELGWRGVAQPELERQQSRTVAALMVGVVWAIWHLPLFRLPGVGQYGTDFAAFAVGAIGGACMLAWLYGRTRSILLCILFHAAWNAFGEMGLSLPQKGSLAMVDGALRLAVGLALVTAGARIRRRAAPERG
jgi:membrane protease YdiL (CAAX protease family)